MSTIPNRLRPVASIAFAFITVTLLRAQPSEIVLHNFQVTGVRGEQPQAGLIRDAAGNLYGTTPYGGTANEQYPFGAGLVFSTDPSGHETVLYKFMGQADGAFPESGLIRDAAGNLYGTTNLGGSATCDQQFPFESGCGVVYKLDPLGNETVLHTFEGVDGANPVAPITFDAAGNLYGTTSVGGLSNYGVVFQLSPSGEYKVVSSFPGAIGGGGPTAGVIRDAAGNLYGTTLFGGDLQACYGFPLAGCGVVYRIDPTGFETVLHIFSGPDGANPGAGLVADATGNLYGTTSTGGASTAGVVFKLNPRGQYTILYNFTGLADGGFPQAGLVLDPTNNLYGTALSGGNLTACPAAVGDAGCGVVFEVPPAGGHESVLYAFQGGTDGSKPAAGVIRDPAGNFYGTTKAGGASNEGSVFKLNVAGQENVLHSFPTEVGGNGLTNSLLLDGQGNIYGVTTGGAPAYSDAYGLIYKLSASGQFAVLYTFMGKPDGASPSSGLIRDAAGNFFGTTSAGGAFNAGTVYKVDPEGQETVLYSFTGGADGSNPQGNLVIDDQGTLYGTTYSGGNGLAPLGAGVVYKLDVSGNQTVLYTFTGKSDGLNPATGVIRDPAGNLYGTTEFGGALEAGNVFKLDRSGQFTVLHTFSYTDGDTPRGGLAFDASGNLYGTTEAGGVADNGVVYKLNPAGQETVLYNFTGEADGGEPFGGLVLDAAGNIYGTTYSGGDVNACFPTPYFPGCGVVFKVDPQGAQTVLHTFTGLADGGNPLAGLTPGTSGNLFGTTFLGGKNYGGVVFKLEHAADAQ